MARVQLESVRDLVAKAGHIRKQLALGTYRIGNVHIGGPMSATDAAVALYYKHMNFDPMNPEDPERDRFILSKGHGGAALLATLAELGFFPLDWLDQYYCDNGKLSGHISHHIPGVEFSTGSLGHGLPVACGMAMAAKQAGKNHRIFCMSSDGDLNEGSSWEAIMLAGQHHFDNLIMLVDYNRLQALGKSKDIIDLESLKEKLEIFGWSAIEVDGHDQNAVYESLRDLPLCNNKPSAIIYRTVKGKGVSFMENDYKWHYGGLTEELRDKAIKEVEEAK